LSWAWGSNRRIGARKEIKGSVSSHTLCALVGASRVVSGVQKVLLQQCVSGGGDSFSDR